jgi:hypothetical protein
VPFLEKTLNLRLYYDLPWADSKHYYLRIGAPDTAYPGTVTHSDWFVGNPRGQCGVSSVWLAEVLAREYSIDSTFCRGSLIIDDEPQRISSTIVGLKSVEGRATS